MDVCVFEIHDDGFETNGLHLPNPDGRISARNFSRKFIHEFRKKNAKITFVYVVLLVPARQKPNPAGCSGANVTVRDRSY